MVNKWQIYWVSLDPVTGSEQAGTRPGLIISNNIVNEVLPVITILPLSSIKEGDRVYPTEVFLPQDLSSLPKDSVAMVHQIRTIAKERIGKQCGGIQDADLKARIHSVIHKYFELTE